MENPFEQIDRRLSNIEELLLAIKHPPITTPASLAKTHDLLTIQQAAEVINLAVPTIYGLVGRNQIPFMKRAGSKRLYFSQQELESWIREGRQKTFAECAQEVRVDLKRRAQ